VQTAHDDHAVIDESVEETIGKPSQQSATGVAAKYWKHPPTLQDRCHREVDGLEEIQAESETLGFVPRTRFFDVRNMRPVGRVRGSTRKV